MLLNGQHFMVQLPADLIAEVEGYGRIAQWEYFEQGFQFFCIKILRFNV